MSNPNVREAEDLEELLTATETILTQSLHLIWVPDAARNELRDVLQRAYSMGYDAAHQDHVDGNVG